MRPPIALKIEENSQRLERFSKHTIMLKHITGFVIPQI